ncbi:MAG: acyl-CoA/acyl-ACP dehydrogenase [Desulfobacterales bacterium]|nr:acyl-CoA/acyl-ACP dehydrogenase [Desulfobacterales bacterium]
MDFIITKEQEQIRKAAREFLKAECAGEFVRELEKSETGFSDRLWRKMAELDWMALIIPEKYNGVGGNMIDLILILEEMGRAHAPGPFFTTVVFGGMGIAEFGSESQKKSFLPEIADARVKMTLALSEPESARWDPFMISVKADKEGSGHVINGMKLFVPDAHIADHAICATRTSGSGNDREGITLFLVDLKSPGVSMTPLKTIAGDKQFEVVFDNVNVHAGDILGEVDRGGDCLHFMLNCAAVCKSAEMVGGGQKVLEMASDYAKARTQFGKRIGSFQAIQHHCANMLIALEGSRFMTYKAAWMLENGAPCDKEIAVAKAWTSDAYREIVALGHQVQGGAAFMEEHDMPLFSRRSAAAAVAYGDSSYYREIVAREMGL